MKIKLLALTLTIAFITGCSAPGPMQTPSGVMNTPVFEPIALSTVNDGSNNVLFKEYTTLYENMDLKLWGVFFVTNKGAYFANWDVTSYKYDLRYKVKIEDITKISEDTVTRDYWADSNLLIITDKNGIEAGFSLIGKNAAKATLLEITDL